MLLRNEIAFTLPVTSFFFRSGPMEIKSARLTVLIDPAKKKAFETLCAQQDVTPSQIVRQLIRDYLKEHSVAWVPSGAGGAQAGD